MVINHWKNGKSESWFPEIKQQYSSQLELNKTNRQLRDAENKVKPSKLDLEQSQKLEVIVFAKRIEKTTDLLESETQMFKKNLIICKSVLNTHTGA
jgi:hypothetical protein